MRRLLWLALLLTLSLPAGASARQARADAWMTLDNGMRVALAVWPGAEVAAIAIRVQVGSRDDPEGAPQLAHLVEHLMYRFRHDDVDHAERLAAIGGVVSAFTGPDDTRYLVVVPPDRVSEALELEARRFGSLMEGITAEDLEAEKRVLLREQSQRSGDAPGGELGELLLQGLFPQGHPYHQEPGLDAEALAAIDLEDVRAFWRRHYGPGQVSLGVVGDLDAQAVRARVELSFGELEARAAPPEVEARLPMQVATRFRYRRDASAWSWLHVSWVTPAAGGLQGLAFDSLEALLLEGARPWLAFELYQGDVVSTVRGSWHRFELGGVFSLEIGYPPTVALDEVLDALRRGLARVRAEGIRDGDLRVASWGAKLSSREALESPLALASWLATDWSLERGPSAYADLAWGLRELEPLEVEQVIADWLRPEAMSLVLSGPELEVPGSAAWAPLGADDGPGRED